MADWQHFVPDPGTPVSAPPQAPPPMQTDWSLFSPEAPAPGAAPAPFVTPPAPPGEIIHQGNGLDVSTSIPSYSVKRQDAPPGAAGNAIQDTNAMEGQALKARANMDAASPVLSEVRRRLEDFTQGGTLNTGDEVLSGANALAGPVKGQGGPGASYDLMQAIQRQDHEKSVKDHPLQTLATELLGGAMTGGGLMARGVTATAAPIVEAIASKLPAGGELGARILAGMIDGLGLGTVANAGAGDGMLDRAKRAVQGAPLAALLGGVSVPVGEALGGVGGVLGKWYQGLKDPEGRGRAVAFERMSQDKTNPNALAAGVERAAQEGQPQFQAVDAGGKNMVRAAGVAAGSPGEFSDEIQRALVSRQAGQGDRLKGFINDAGGIGQGQDAYATTEQLLARRKAAAGPAYERSYGNPAPQGPAWMDMLTRQSVQDAAQGVRKIAAEKQLPLTDMFTRVPNPNPQMRTVRTMDDMHRPTTSQVPVDPEIEVPTVRGWDNIKREQDTQIGQLYKTGDTTQAEAVKETRNQLRDSLGNEVPGYREALGKFSDDTSLIEALKRGEEMGKAPNLDAGSAEFRNGSPVEQEMSRRGLARQMQVPIDAAKASADKSAGLTSSISGQRADILATDPQARALFADRLGREVKMKGNANEMLGGSKTFEKTMESGSSQRIGSVLAALSTGQLGRSAGLIGDMIMRGAQGLGPQAASELGRILTTSDPAKLRGLQSLFEAAVQRANMPSAIPPMLRGTAAARTEPDPKDRRLAR